MKPWFFPHIGVVLFTLLLVPACPGEKGNTTDDTGSSTDADTSTGANVTTSGAVLTSTNSSSGTSTGPDSSSTDPSTGPDSTSEMTATTGEPAISCADEPLYFPTFDRSCTVNEDCSVVFHQIDCCGNSEAWGINADAAKAFAEAEEICMAQYPGCGCPAGPPTADDGDPVINPDFIEVACTDGQCMSSVP